MYGAETSSQLRDASWVWRTRLEFAVPGPAITYYSIAFQPSGRLSEKIDMPIEDFHSALILYRKAYR